MKKDFFERDKYYPCLYPGCKDGAKDFHEIFGSAYRNLSIKYNLQIQLCRKHHKSTKEYQVIFCKVLFLNHSTILHALRNHKHSDRARKYLYNTGVRLLKYYEEKK